MKISFLALGFEEMFASQENIHVTKGCRRPNVLDNLFTWLFTSYEDVVNHNLYEHYI